MGSIRRAGGFTQFELVVCLLLMVVVASTLYSRYMALVVDAERAAFRGVLGWLQAGVNVRMSLAVTSGDLGGLHSLEGSNPMVLVAQVMEPPSNYLGELAGAAAQEARRGSWYFDPDHGVLVYRTKYQRAFDGFVLADDERIGFQLKLRYGSADKGSNHRISGLGLEMLDSDGWQRAFAQPLR